MIQKMMNLECAKHHKHFAPNPGAWVGQECKTIIDLTAKGRPIKCTRKLRRIK